MKCRYIMYRAAASVTVRVGKRSCFLILYSNFDHFFSLRHFLTSSFWPSGWAIRPPGRALATSLIMYKPFFFFSMQDRSKCHLRMSCLKEPSPIFTTFFPNFWGFWYHKKLIFVLITHVKCHGWKKLHLEDIKEKVHGYGNHNQ